MFATARPQPNILQAQLSITGLIAAMLDPVVVVGMLWAVAHYHEELFDTQYIIVAVLAFSLTYPGSPHWKSSLREMYRDILISSALLAGLLIFFGYASGTLRLFPGAVVTSWLVAAPLALLASHHLVRYGLPRIMSAEGNQRRAVIAGANPLGLQLARKLRDNPDRVILPVGFFDDRRSDRLGDLTGFSFLGSLTDLAAFVKQHRIDQIYINLPMASQPRILRLLDDLRDTTTSIYFVPDIFLTDLIQGRMESLGGIPLVSVCESPFTGLNGIVKRLSDVVMATCILLLTSPLLLAIAVGVKYSSPGPVLFRQRRYGVDGRDIAVYKFRSMTVCEDGKLVRQATRNDQRVTRLGTLLRRTSLDELPQFINVLQGRMSVVGPRPHAVAHNEQYRKLIKGYMVRHKVKPGITGWAQVNGFRGETDVLEKMQARIDFDLEYLRHWSLKLDLMIVARTVLIVLRDRHAY